MLIKRGSRELLNRQRPENRPADQADVEDLRSWEWRYLWQLCLDNAYEVLLESKGREVTGLSVSHTGRYLAASCGDHIFVRDLIDDVPVADFPGSHAIFSPTETLLAYWAPNIDDKREGSFRLWDATSMQVVNNALLNTGRGIRGVGFSADGRTLVVATANWNLRHASQLILVEVATSNLINAFAAPQMVPGEGYPFAMAGDMSLVAHGSGTARNSFVRVVDPQTGDELWRSTSAPIGEWIECLAISPNNRLLVIGHGWAQPTLEVWDIDKRSKVAQLVGHMAYVRDVVFADQHTLVSCSARPNRASLGSGRRGPHSITSSLSRSQESSWACCRAANG